MHDDDAPIGRLLSRREVLALLGAAGVSALGGRLVLGGPRKASGAHLPSCIARPEQTEGPYFVDEALERSDIRPDPATGVLPEGVPLQLTFRVSRVAGTECRPLPGAIVHVWQCDALGAYSDVRDIQGRFDTVGQKFLRGHQVTDGEGTARFTTIYPGWYEGRTVHIHFKVRTSPGAEMAYEFTSQLYFDDAVTDEVMRAEPYTRKGSRSVRNERDAIFRRSGGDRLMLSVSPSGQGYAGSFDIGLQFDGERAASIPGGRSSSRRGIQV